jgi:hypothetical protein
MTKKRVLLKKSILLAVLVMTLILGASLTAENIRAATPAPGPETTATSKPSLPPDATSKFAYQTQGNQKSTLPEPQTITLCNYTTPPNIGTITQISIYLTANPKGTQIRAIILPNDPDSNMPQVGDPLLQTYAINATSISGEWYNFKINYTASPNTTYWLGYYADTQTQYFYDTNNDHVSLTSQTKDENSTLFPVLSWRYVGKTIMSLYAQYTIADPQQTPTPTNIPQHTPTQANTDSTTSTAGLAQSIQETFFVLLIMGAEATIVITNPSNKKRTPPTNNSI